jgi:lipid-binding SYLF domain-containing protein
MKVRSFGLMGIVSIVVMAFLVEGCATLSLEERTQKRNEIDTMADKAIAELIEENPKIQKKMDKAIGYMIVDAKVTKIPVFGAGSGTGVVVDKITDTTTYIKVTRYDIGGGLGTRTFKSILLFKDRELLDAAKDGKWIFRAGAEASAGSATSEGSSGSKKKGYELYVLSEGGASVTWTVYMIRIKPYSELMK